MNVLKFILQIFVGYPIVFACLVIEMVLTPCIALFDYSYEVFRELQDIVNQTLSLVYGETDKLYNLYYELDKEKTINILKLHLRSAIHSLLLMAIMMFWLICLICSTAIAPVVVAIRIIFILNHLIGLLIMKHILDWT